MTPEDYRRVSQAFEQIRELPDSERAAALDAACDGDATLRAGVLRLLDADRAISGDSFLNKPAVEDAAHLLDGQFSGLPAPGTEIGNYRLGSRIGAGGMGVVYEGQDLRLERRVAIKILPAAAGEEGTERVKRFQREARAASHLNHPNIVSIFDADFDRGHYYIATEFIEGKTLRELLIAKPKGLDAQIILDVLTQTASALNAAHESGIVHRDIKPENIMLRTDGFVKLLDFGLAKQRERAGAPSPTISEFRTRPGLVAGTIQYLSPEQVTGRIVDGRSDVFSLGVVAYELATGRRPFDGPTDGAVYDAILNHAPPSPSSVRPSLGTDFDHVILQALEKDPELRFQSANELARACKRLTRDSLRPSSAAIPVRRKATIRAWIPWAAAGLATASALGILYFSQRSHQPAAPQTLVSVTTYPGSEMYPSFSPDGKQIAFFWEGERGVQPGIYVKLVSEPTPLRLTSGVDSYPAWIPDGSRIAFGREGSNPGIYSVSALGGMERKLASLGPNSQMSWSPDGRWLAFSATSEQERGILLLPADGGQVRSITNPRAPLFDRAPAFSADGHSLAYAACASIYSCNVYVQKLDANQLPEGQSREMVHLVSSVSGLAWTKDGKSIVYAASRSAAILPYLWQATIGGSEPPRRLEVAGPNASSPSISSTGNRLLFQRTFGAEDIWRFRKDGAMEPFFTSSLAANRNPQFSPDGTKIAFESSRSGDAGEIWVAQADGSNPVQLTHRVGRHQGTPRWSPNGRWIAFDSEGEDGQWDIYVMDAGGAPPRRVTFAPSDDAMPFWSHDGQWIYFRSNRSGAFEIWRVPFAGGTEQQMTIHGGSVGYESADGQTLFYSKGSMSGPLYARPLAGGEEQQLVPYINFKAFVAMPEGIYYVGQRTDEGYYPLSLFQFSSRKSQLLAKIQGRAYQGLSVSPDRQTILFCKLGGLGADLMMIDNF